MTVAPFFAISKTATPLVAALGVASFFISACSTNKAPTRDPVPLVALQNQQVQLSPIFTHNVGKPASWSQRLLSHTAGIQHTLRPVINGDQLLLAAPNGVVSSFVAGKSAWTKQLASSIVGGMALEARSQIAIVSTQTGKAVALNSQTGEVLWEQQLPSTVITPAIIAGNRVLLSATNGVIYGLKLQTGAQVWQFNTQNPAISVRGTAQPLRLDGNTALFGAANGRIYAINSDSGTPLWARRIGMLTSIGTLTDVDSAPLVVGDHLYITSFAGDFFGFNLKTGAELFHVQDFPTSLGVAHLNGVLIGANRDGMIYGFDASNGKYLWQNNALHFRQPTTPVVIGDYVAVGDYEGVVHVLSRQGDIIGRVKSTGPITSLHAENGRLYAQSSSGTVMAWQLQ